MKITEIHNVRLNYDNQPVHITYPIIPKTLAEIKESGVEIPTLENSWGYCMQISWDCINTIDSVGERVWYIDKSDSKKYATVLLNCAIYDTLSDLKSLHQEIECCNNLIEDLFEIKENL